MGIDLIAAIYRLAKVGMGDIIDPAAGTVWTSTPPEEDK